MARALLRLFGSLRRYVKLHLHALVFTLGQASRRPVGTSMTVAVVGIALALPSGLEVALSNLRSLQGAFHEGAEISLFLRLDLPSERGIALAEQLRQEPGVAEVQYVSREEALQEFAQMSGMGDVLGALNDNPLPDVVLVRPARTRFSPGDAEALRARLATLPEVDLAKLDLEWLRRLKGLLDIGRRVAAVLAGLLSLAVLLVVGNTIRLDIENHREEIVVQKLVGATDAFVRRPFLYTGIWHGLLGGGFAWLLVNMAVGLVRPPVGHLAAAYGSEFQLKAPDLADSALLLVGGALLGLVGAWLAVARQLREIEPA